MSNIWIIRWLIHKLFSIPIEVDSNFKKMTYSVLNAGGSCEAPITTMDACKKSTESLFGVIYAEPKGDGRQLPHGCVMDSVTPGKTYIYWNKDGGAKSLDPKLGTICQTPLHDFE